MKPYKEVIWPLDKNALGKLPVVFIIEPQAEVSVTAKGVQILPDCAEVNSTPEPQSEPKTTQKMCAPGNLRHALLHAPFLTL